MTDSSTTTAWGTYHSTWGRSSATVGQPAVVGCGLWAGHQCGQWPVGGGSAPANSRSLAGCWQPAGLSREGKGSPGQGRAGPPTARSTSDSLLYHRRGLVTPGHLPLLPHSTVPPLPRTSQPVFGQRVLRASLSPLAPTPSRAPSSTVAVLLHHHGAHTTKEPTKSIAPSTSVQSGKVSRRRAPAGMPAAP